MTITTTTCIGFKIPEEAELLRRFTQSHALDEWKINATTNWINYEKSEAYIIDVNIEKEGEE